jgi:hypothetical protein
MKKPALILVKTVLLAALAALAGMCLACSGLPGQPNSTPTRIVPEAGQGGLTGQIEQAASLWPKQPVIIYAATFKGDESSGGVYVLEPSLYPQTTLAADGSFQLNNLAPGRYVLVAGPDAEDARAVVDAKQQARVIEVKANAVLELGKLELAP